MKKRHLLVMAVLVVAMGLAIVVPVSACTQGCTPGYWKQEQHWDSWMGYAPGDYFDEVFDLEGVAPHITLLQALNAQGGGVNAFLRHAVAALLNATHPDVEYVDPSWVSELVGLAYESGEFESIKNIFAPYNELGCPLN